MDGPTIFILNQKQVFQDLALGLNHSLSNLGYKSAIVSSPVQGEDLHICFGLNDWDGPLPRRYVAYQLEQTGNRQGPDWFGPEYIRRLRGAVQIWDYSIRNLQNLKQKGLTHVRYVPLLYSPILDRIPRLPNQDRPIDVLFYGSKNHRRQKILTELRNIGIKAEFHWYDLWGTELDTKISQAKIVLNIHYYENPILECSRLSYLIANQVFVISEPSSDPILDKFYQNLGVVFSEYDHLVESVIKYMIQGNEREQIANQTHDQFQEHLWENTILGVLPEVLEIPTPKSSANFNQSLSTPTVDAEPKQGPPPQSGENGKQTLQYLQAEMESSADGELLKLPDIPYSELPYVSILTLTYNRSELLPIALRNFHLIEYPEDRLEWVIVDDSNPRHQRENQAILPKGDPRIKYIPLEHRISISEKRNLAAGEASHDILVHMDDDDYYPSMSLLARVKLLLKYASKGARCVGCTQIGIYNLMENYSYLMDTPYPAEASLAYTRDFWEEQPFPDRDVPEGEGIPFLHKRSQQVVIMPYMFNLIAITHHKNITGKLRTLEIDPEENYTNYFNLWDLNTQLFFLEILSEIKKSDKRSKQKNHRPK